MSQSIITQLEKYGLSKPESKIYLALVKRLEANVTELSKDTRIPRTTVYKILARLESEKLVAKLMKNKIRYFTLTKIKQLEFNLNEKQDAVSELLPALRELIFTAQRDPSVKFMTGKEALYVMWEDILESFQNTEKENYALAGTGAHYFQPRYFPRWKTLQKQLRVKPQIVYPVILRDIHAEQPESVAHIDKKYLEDFDFEGAINLYGGSKIAIASFNKKEPQVILVDSLLIYSLFLVLWRVIWSTAKH